MQWYSYVYVTYTPRMALTGGSAAKECGGGGICEKAMRGNDRKC